MNISERRHFQRVHFICDVLIHHNNDEWNSELEDISLKGVLINSPDNILPQLEEIYDITLVLGKDATIKMQAKISYANERHWGLYWENIDIEHFTHLRKLLELNTQDPNLVHRELSELGKTNITS